MYLERLQEIATAAGIVLDGLSEPPSKEPWPIVSLSGATIDFGGLDHLGPGVATRQILLEGGALGGGWTAVPKGHGLWVMSPLDGSTEAVVSIGSATVAFIRIDQPPEDGAQHLLIWQGEWHDLCTFDYDRLDDALSALSALTPVDSKTGVVLDLPSDTTIMDESVVISLDPFIVGIRSSAATAVPRWRGVQGRHAEFYVLGDASPDGVLALANGAACFLA